MPKLKKTNIISYFTAFEEKFRDLETIDIDWYKKNCGVHSNCKSCDIKGKKSNYLEEWYRARMVWSMVESKLFDPEVICVEFSIPKGSEGAKSINPDIVVFKDKNWKKDYDKWDKSSSVPEVLKKNFLVFFEVKENSKKMENAIKKQLEVAMESYIGEQVFGVYLDNELNPLIFRKESSQPIKRYYPDKAIDGEEIEKLNLGNRDDLITMPSHLEFVENITATEDVSKLNFETNQPIDEDSFTELLEVINRLQDRLNVSHIQDLVVEFLTLKVADEKAVKKGEKEFFDFYITKEEKDKKGFGEDTFRKRFENLYQRSKEEYKSIFKNREFKYIPYKVSGLEKLRPNHADDEKFLIGVVEVFQKKTILNTHNKNFNQIIFNNFGNNIEKAKEKQFFTPVPIVEAIVKMVNPQKEETICDPCSGICDFLAMAFRHIHSYNVDQVVPASNLYGFDKDNKILKLAELNLVLNGDGNANIYNMDSIVDKLLVDGSYRDIDFTTDYYNSADWNNLDDENKNLKKYDVILTNPPFGKGRDLKTGKSGKWDVPKKSIELYETWSVTDKPNSIDMGVIFLENAYKALKEGGRMAIVLSNSIASIKTWESVREWLISKMRIVALFDLPPKTFGETGVATTVIIAYKPKVNETHLLEEDYEVYIREIENVGYTVKSKERIVIMSPNFVINEVTFEREKDSSGNDKRLTDLPSLVNDFYSWLDEHKHTYKEIYNAFHMDNFQKWGN